MNTSGRATPATRVRLRFIAILLFCLSVLIALTGCQKEYMATGEGPVISLEKTSHDFGQVGPTTVHTGEFKFTNTGTAPLVIKSVKVCCGTVTKGVKEGQSYAPGRSGTLEVEYHASTEPGVMQRELYLYTNDPDNQVVPLTIEGEVMQRIEFAPSRLRLFLNRDNAGAENLTIKSLDGRPFAITDFRSTADTIVAAFDPDAKATEFVLEPRADLEKLKDHPRGQIKISLNHPECPEVLVLYDVLPEFTIVPSPLMDFSFAPGKTIRREINIFGNYDENYEIESVTSEKGLVTLVDQSSVKRRAADLMTSASEPDRIIKRYTLIVDFTAPEDEDTTALSDELQIKMVGGETITLDCRGYYAGG